MREHLLLFRPKISLMVGLSAFAGTCLFNGSITITHIYAVLSVIFLSAGCSALNQYQESEQDKLMTRTKKRPIPNGSVKPFEAVRFAMLFLALSFAMMSLTGSIYGLVMIVATILIYNFAYTPLKKKTPFALLIGSVTGAVPPLMGWVAVGGSPFSSEILIISAVLYIWQTPHFALLSEKYADDYKLAGFFTLSATYGRFKADIFIKIWLTAFISALSIIPISNIYHYWITSFLHITLTFISALLFIVFSKDQNKTFHILNLCMILFFLMLVVDRIII